VCCQISRQRFWKLNSDDTREYYYSRIEEGHSTGFNMMFCATVEIDDHIFNIVYNFVNDQVSELICYSEFTLMN